MRAENCQGCKHLWVAGGIPNCAKHRKPISKVRGCSHSSSGKMFFRARSGKEAFRVNVLGKKKGETK